MRSELTLPSLTALVPLSKAIHCDCGSEQTEKSYEYQHLRVQRNVTTSLKSQMSFIT